MTDIERLAQAKTYIENLAEGSPVSGMRPADLTDCLRYAADILGQVIANGGEINTPATLRGVRRCPDDTAAADFSITPEQLFAIQVSEKPVTVNLIAQRVNAHTQAAGMKKLPVSAITSWLVDSCILAEMTDADGSKRKTPTVRGNRIGVRSALRKGPRGEYTAVLYDENAQRFLIQSLDGILCRHREGEKELEE